MAEERHIGIPEEPLDYTSDLSNRPYELDENKYYDNDFKHEVVSSEIKRTVVSDNWKIPAEPIERRPQIEQALAGAADVIDLDSFGAKEYIKWRTDPAGTLAGYGSTIALGAIAPVPAVGGAVLTGLEKTFPETFSALKPTESKELTRGALEQAWEKELQKESQKLDQARADLESGKIPQQQFDAMQKNFDTLVARRQSNLEKVDKFNTAVQALDGVPYPNKKFADASVVAATEYLQAHELNKAIEMAQQGIDPESTGYKLTNIVGPTAILAGSAVGTNYLARYGLANTLKRITTSGRTEAGAARLASIKPVRSRREAAKIGEGFVQASTAELESTEYAWETIKDYIERTGDKTLSEFNPQDLHAFMGAAYGAIAGKIETMGGIESIASGAMRKLGVGGFWRRTLATGGEEMLEDVSQDFTEFLSRKINGTTDETFGEFLEREVNTAAWSGGLGIAFGSIGGVAYRNARRQGTKVLQKYGLSRETAEKVFDSMVDQVSDSISPQNETVRENVRQKVAAVYENADLDPVELDDTVEAITDLEMAFIAQDSAEKGIDIADNPILQGEVNEIGWFREGIPEQVSDQVRTLNDEIAGLRQQLREETAREIKDYNKIEDLEAKIEQFYAKLPQEISDIVETDRAKVRQMLDEQMARARDLQDRRKVVRQVQQRALKALQREQESDVQKSLRRLQEQTRTEEQKARTEERKQWQEQRKLRKAIEKLRQDMVRRKSKLPVSQELFADADLVYQALRDSGFTDSQISTMAETDIINAVMPYGISPQILKQSDLATENARLDDIYPAYDGDTIEVDGKERTVYNSNGDRIAKSKEALTNFWRWFGDSKVVDEQGRPLVVYHNSGERRTILSREYARTASDVQGVFFAPKPDPYKEYGPYEHAVYLKIENPADFETTYRKHGIELGRTYDAGIKVREWLQNNGYDGSMLYEDGKLYELIAFEPNQIKSVDNRGTYSADTGNIYYQSAMYLNPRAEITDFVKYVLENPNAKKSYISITTKDGLSIDIPSDTILHDYNGHALTAKQWVSAQEALNNIKTVSESKRKGIYGNSLLLRGETKKGKSFGFVIDMSNGRNILTTAFEGSKTGVENWQKERAGRSQGAAANSAQAVRFYTLGQPAFKGIINTLKENVKILPQTRISGKGKDFRGFYAPELRLISLAQNADPTTLAHELAHDWMQQFFRHYRSGKASESFMKSWGAVEKALGITENDITVPDKASEAFARAYEAWVMNNKDWAKNIDIEDKDRDKMIEIFKRYQGYLTDVYEDLNNPYFLETWGETGKLKPELQAWFDKVTNPTDLIDAQVQTGKITPEQAQTKQITRTVNEVVQAVENEFTPEEKEEIAAVERMNDTSRYEVEGGNKNSLQNRLSGLARDIDANNIALKRYDTHRDMLEVAKAADDFVRTRRDEAMNIINGIEPEKEGLYASDLYTALERFAVENNDVDLALELTNSKVAKDLAKEWGQRIAGFRNFTGDGDFDVISQLKSLDNKFKKDYDEKGKERVNTAADEYVEELNKADDSQDVDAFLDSIKCQ